MKYLKKFEALDNDKINRIKDAVQGRKKNRISDDEEDVYITYKRKNSDEYRNLAGPLKMTQYTSGCGLSGWGVSFFSSYSPESVYKSASKSDKIRFYSKEESKEIEKTMKYIRDAFYKLPQVAFSASKGKESPWRVFGMSTPKYCFDGEVLHIDLNVPREVRHPDEYPSYHNNSDYDYTFKRIDEIESAVLDVADYIEEKGYKVDISAW